MSTKIADPRKMTFRIEEQPGQMVSGGYGSTISYHIYGDFPCGPKWMGKFPSKKTAEQFLWGFKHSHELLYALKHARAIIEEERESGAWFDDKELNYIDGVIDLAVVEKEAMPWED